MRAGSEPTGSGERTGNELFPVFLKLNDLRVVLIGGGVVGLEKLNALLDNSPAVRVRVVALTVSREIRDIAAERPHVTWVEKPFVPDDLNDADVVMSALNDPEVTATVREAARARKLLLNAADKPELCDFYLGSVVRKGHLKIGISTNGKSPTMAKRVKEILNESFPPEIEETLEHLVEIRKGISGDIQAKIKVLNEATSAYRQRQETTIAERFRKTALFSALVLVSMVSGHFIISSLPDVPLSELWTDARASVGDDFWLFVLGGFAAQMIDGALGMAYGVTVTTFLLSLGIPSITPAVASASMHASEVFSTGASSIFYMRYRNINKRLFKALVWPGILGAVAGAAVVSFVSKEHIGIIRPVIACYTLTLGVLIVLKTLRSGLKKRGSKSIPAVALAGGFFDSVGGGGWGPIVTTSIIARGRDLRFAIGTSHLAKFFVACVSTVTFFAFIGLEHWVIIFGLIIGGMVAAPLSIYISTRIPTRPGLLLVGAVVIILSLRTLIRSLL
jgi:uncharacterized protein